MRNRRAAAQFFASFFITATVIGGIFAFGAVDAASRNISGKGEALVVFSNNKETAQMKIKDITITISRSDVDRFIEELKKTAANLAIPAAQAAASQIMPIIIKLDEPAKKLIEAIAQVLHLLPAS